MNDDHRTQIYRKLNQEETEVLVTIWQTNDQFEWSETAFEVIQEILEERMGELPTQNEAVYTQDEEYSAYLFDENTPILFEEREVLSVATWLERAAIASVIISIIRYFYNAPGLFNFMISVFTNETGWDNWIDSIAYVVTLLSMSITCIISYLSLKALASILIILLDMEFNSRNEEQITNSESLDPDSIRFLKPS